MEEENKDIDKGKEFIHQIETDLIENVLTYVIDPEIEIDIVNLGLIYELKFDGSNTVEIVMTMSTPACLLSDAIVQNVRETIMKKYTNFLVNVEVVFEPLWHPGLISKEGREMLEM